VSNAVKFTPAEGRVDISARPDDGQVEIAVADTGLGIAPEELETIFEEFKQATNGKRAEGTGSASHSPGSPSSSMAAASVSKAPPATAASSASPWPVRPSEPNSVLPT
jgi:hypothetical protein